MKQKLILLGLVTGLVMVSHDTQSLGMGKIQVHSALDQPLQANIDLMISEGEDLSDLNVKIASDADYKKVGLDRTFVPSSIEVRRDENNPTLIEVFSSGPISEPIVSLLLDVNWKNGRILREFTILLDPPVYQSDQSVVQAQQPDLPDQVNESEIQRPQESVAQTRAEASQPEIMTTGQRTGDQDVSNEDTNGDSYSRFTSSISVESGDTLWSLANVSKPSQVSTQQMMMALFSHNPQAFINGNINQLKKGSVLDIPQRHEVESLSQSEALSMVQNHIDRWTPSADSQSGDYTSIQTSDDGQYASDDGASEIDYGVELAGGSDVNSSDGVSSGSDVSDPTITEELYNTESENLELKDRVSELEELLEQQQAVIELKNNDMANLEQQMATVNDSDEVLEVTETDDVWGDAQVENDAIYSGSADISADSDSTSSSTTVEQADKGNITSESDEDTKQVLSTSTEPVSPPQFSGTQQRNEPTMIEKIIEWVMSNLTFVVIGIISLVVLVFGLRFFTGRSKDVSEETSFFDDIKARNQSKEDQEEDVLVSDFEETEVNEPLAVEESEQNLDAGEDVLEDLRKAGFDVDEDDEGEDEDIFKGFDDDDTSDQIETDVAEKLDDDNQGGFDFDGFLNDEDQGDESLFEQSTDDVITKDLTEDARKATEASQPDNEQEDIDFSELDELDFEKPANASDLASRSDDLVEETEMSVETSEEIVEDDLELDLDNDDFNLDLEDMEEFDISDSDADLSEEAIDVVDSDVDSIEESFDEVLDLDGDTIADLEVETEEVVDDSDLDLGEDIDNMLDEGDVIDTKLDLAKAYMEMGDVAGARNLLKEVAAEGNDAQVEAAKKLLDEM